VGDIPIYEIPPIQRLSLSIYKCTKDTSVSKAKEIKKKGNTKDQENKTEVQNICKSIQHKHK
jgi:hypothetical protein